MVHPCRYTLRHASEGVVVPLELLLVVVLTEQRLGVLVHDLGVVLPALLAVCVLQCRARLSAAAAFTEAVREGVAHTHALPAGGHGVGVLVCWVVCVCA